MRRHENTRGSRPLRWLAAVVASGLVIAACGEDPDEGAVGDGDDTELDDTDTDETDDLDDLDDEDVEEIEMEVDPDHEGETIELSHWSFIDTHVQFLQARASEFNEQNDDYNIVIESVVMPFAEMHDRLLISLQSGVGAPDIVGIENQRYPTFLRGEGALHTLTDVVDPYRDVLVEERLAPYQSGGEQYGIDFQFGAFVMFYNDAILSEAGVDIDDIVTWDDYIEAGEQVVANTDAYMTAISADDRLSLSALMLQNGGGLYDENNQPIIDTPENLEAVEMARAMVHEHEIATPTPGGAATDPVFFEEFNAGNYASVWMPMWYITRFNDFMPDLAGDMRVRPLPEFEEGGYISTMGGGTAMSITTSIDDDKLEPTKEFFAFALLEYDSQVKSWTEMQWDPQRSDVYEDPALQEPIEYFGDEPVMAVLQESGMLDRLAPEYMGHWYAEAVLDLSEQVAYGAIEQNEDPEPILRASAERIGELEAGESE